MCLLLLLLLLYYYYYYFLSIIIIINNVIIMYLLLLYKELTKLIYIYNYISFYLVGEYFSVGCVVVVALLLLSNTKNLHFLYQV